MGDVLATAYDPTHLSLYRQKGDYASSGIELRGD
jgi:hypothetical protein